MKGKRTLKRHGRAIKLTAFLAASLCLLGLLAGCGQAASSQTSAESPEKSATQVSTTNQSNAKSSLQSSSSSSSPAPTTSTSTNSLPDQTTSNSDSVSSTATSTPSPNSAGASTNENPGPSASALSASEIQTAQQVRSYLGKWINEVQNNAGPYGYPAWNDTALIPKALIPTLSDAQLWSAYEQSENNCVSQQLTIPNCGVDYASGYIDGTTVDGNFTANTLSLTQVKSILKQEIPWAHITRITYSVFPNNNFPCYFVYTTQSLASDQPFWYVNANTGYAINIYGEAASQPQTPVTKQNYIPALMRLYAVFGQGNSNYTWGSAWVNKLPNSTLLSDFFQANPSYQLSQGNIITNSMIQTAIQWMTQNAWAGPEAPYSLSEASQMIKQELWFGTYDNSVGPLTISKIVQHGTTYYIYVQGYSGPWGNGPWGGVNTQTGAIGNA